MNSRQSQSFANAKPSTRERDPKEEAARLKKRYASERRFRYYGMGAVGFAVLSLVIFLFSIFSAGFGAFFRTNVTLTVDLDSSILGAEATSDQNQLETADYYTVVKNAIFASVPQVSNRAMKRQIASLITPDANLELRAKVLENPAIIGTKVPIAFSAASDLDQMHKGNAPRDIEEAHRRLSDFQLGIYDQWLQQGMVDTQFNWQFFTTGDSRNPEQAGIGGAILGSVFTLLVCFLVSFPVGVAAAVYLEEFAPRNRWTEIIEVNINNLAAVPSIIYGLLGLAVILNVFGLPRGTPLVGGIVLAIVTLPTIIIASRSALKGVPPSIREGALAIGASPMQVVFHHVLPLALPGTLTGTILGLARALGETAPLLMIGMVAFVVDVPGGATDSSTALPVQIYLWAESAERGFVEKTAAAIMIILGFLLCMNSIAVVLRSRFERRW